MIVDFKMYYHLFTVVVLFFDLTSSYTANPVKKPENKLLQRNSRNFKCGESRNTMPSPRIIEGANASLGDWPWMVSLGYRTSSDPHPAFKCAGSLISKEWFIGAAHCFKNIEPLILTVVRIGDLNLNDSVDDGASPINVDANDMEIITHPQYSTVSNENDIALIRLKKPIIFTELMHSICMLTEDKHTKDEFYLNKTLYLVGWGHTNYGGPFSEVLQETQLGIEKRESCSRKYELLHTNKKIDDRVLCAGNGKTDACQGDSGGPLMVLIEDNYYLAGIVSFGYKCANSNPGVYTNVAKFSDWIRKITKIQF